MNCVVAQGDQINICATFLQRLACSPEVDKDDMKSTLEVAIKANGLETEIRNMVYHLVRRNGKGDPKSPVQVRK